MSSSLDASTWIAQPAASTSRQLARFADTERFFAQSVAVYVIEE
jgi:hypothetical protein